TKIFIASLCPLCLCGFLLKEKLEMEKTRNQIPIARPELNELEERAALEVIRSGWIMQGAKVADFERAFASYVGAEEAIAVSSGTAALHISLLAAGCGQGGTIHCPSYRVIATAHVIIPSGGEWSCVAPHYQ